MRPWVLVLLVFVFRLEAWGEKCKNLWTTDKVCDGEFQNPKQNHVWYGDDPVNKVSVSWSNDEGRCEATNYQIHSTPTEFASATTVQSKSALLTIPKDNQGLEKEGPYTLRILSTCWEKDRRGNWQIDRQCWISNDDRENTCTLDFTYCRKQPLSSLYAPDHLKIIPYGTTQIPFSWSDSESVIPTCRSTDRDFYYLFLVRDENQVSIFGSAAQTVRATSYNLPTSLLIPGKTYTWSVRSSRQIDKKYYLPSPSNSGTTNIQTTFPSFRTFTYCAQDVSPTAPILTSPASNQDFDSNTSTMSITFQWSITSFGYTCLPASTLFKFFISSTPTFGTTPTKLITASESQSTYSTTENLGGGTTYWKVVAVKGAETSSISQQFSICILTPPQSFNLVSPYNGEQEINYSIVSFSWTASSHTSTCTTNSITYELYASQPGQTPSKLYSGPSTAPSTIVIEKGTWSWYVIAKDSKGKTTQSATFSFVTLDSLCTDVPPVAPTLFDPSYNFNSNDEIEVSIQWSLPDFGVSCETTKRSGSSILTLKIYGDSSTPILETNLPETTTSYLAVLDPGAYTWELVLTNAAELTVTSSGGAFSICDLSSMSTFVTSLSPSDGTVILGNSISSISWEFPNPQLTCLGGTIVYTLLISGPSSFFLEMNDQSITSYDISELGPGTWTWTLSSDASDIPISNIPSNSISNTIYSCQPSYPLNPTPISPGMFTQWTKTTGTMKWAHQLADTDSCAPLATASVLSIVYIQQLYVSNNPNFGNTPQCVLDTISSNYSCDITYAASGVIYWKAQVVKRIIINDQVASELTASSQVSILTICQPIAPVIPDLIFPPQNTTLQRCNITTKFQWEPLFPTDFGISCTSLKPEVLLVVSTDPTFSSIHETFEPVFTEGEISSGNLLTYLSETTYYWRLEISNGQVSSHSEVFSFTTPNYSETPCSGHGTCTSVGTCSCELTYDGRLCENHIISTQAPTTANQGETQKENAQPIIIGVVVGVLGFLIILAIILFFIARKMSPKAKGAYTRVPPNYPALAFLMTPYAPFDDSKIVPWYSFEQLVSTNMKFRMMMIEACQPQDLEQVVRSLVYTMEFQRKGAEFVKELISYNILQKKQTGVLESSTLFRENSPASAAFRIFARIKGLPFLWQTVGAAVDELVRVEIASIPDENEKEKDGLKQSRRSTRNSSNLELSTVVVRSTSTSSLTTSSFEVDPSRMDIGDDENVNSLALQLRCQKILVSVFRASNNFPTDLTSILSHLMEEVTKNLSKDDGYISVAGFIFLRFVNPSILFPSQYGLIENSIDYPGIKRQLVLIAKVLQNLANNVKFGQKEKHMISMNDFIDSNENSLRHFLDQVSTVSNEAPENVEDLQPTTPIFSVKKDAKKKGKDVEEEPTEYTMSEGILKVPRNVVESSLTILYNHLYYNKDTIFEGMSKYGTKEESTLVQTKCTGILNAIGEPPSMKTMEKSKEKVQIDNQ